MDPEERELLRRIPKAELHLHLEGSLSPADLWQLSQRHGIPHGLHDLEACRALYRFDDFAGFIRAIKTASQHLMEPADYAAAVREMARRLAADGVVYAEVFWSAGILLWRGVAIEPFWAAMEEARLEAAAETGVTLRWIFDAVRQFGPQPFLAVLDWALRLRPSGAVIGIGIGGDEATGPAQWFREGFQRARAAGLLTTVHAGETLGAEGVRAALELEPHRIGHGLHAFENPAVVTELVRAGIVVDVCPTSNLRTGCWRDAATHPVRHYCSAGVRVAIGSDDPGIFGCSLLDEYALLRDHAGFSAAEVAALARGSLAFAFAP